MRCLAALLLVGASAPAWGALEPPKPLLAAGGGGPALSADDPLDDAEGTLSKKHQALADKAQRKRVHLAGVRDRVAHPSLTLRNVWTRELVAVDPTRPPPRPVIDGLLRDHFTNQATRMDPRLGDVLTRAAARFKATLIEVVSGYRSAKYNLMLRKKGHAVARESQHPLGNAVDFRVAGVPTRVLFKFIRALRLGGAGYYPSTGFVHADVGPVRTWVGN